MTDQPDQAAMNVTPDGPPGVVNQQNEHGSAARSTTMVSAADAGITAAQGPAIADAQSVLGKRSQEDALSPDHLGKVAQATPSAPERTRALVLKGLAKEQRDRIKAADDQLELTKAVRTLEANQKQMEEYLRTLHRAGLHQDQNVEVLRQANLAADKEIEDNKKTFEDYRATAAVQFQEFQRSLTAKDGWLGEQLQKQEAILTERMVEIREMFVACDKVIKQLEEVQDVEGKTDTLLEKLRALASPNKGKDGDGYTTPPTATGTAESAQDVPAHTITLKALDEARRSGNLLRTRCDELQKEINKLHETVQGVEVAQVAMQVEIQDAAHRVETVAAWSHQQDLLTDAHSTDRDNVLGAQIASLTAKVQEAVDGVCRCPGNCPGRSGSKSKDDDPKPKDAETGRLPLIPKGPGGGAPGGGGHGGDPGGGGGGGPGRGPPEGHDSSDEDDADGRWGRGPSYHHMGGRRRDAERKLTKASKSPFETKAAKDDLPRYDGAKDKIGLWRRKTMYYLHSKCSDMKTLLEWAEKRPDAIDNDELVSDTYFNANLQNLEQDAAVLSYFLWGFLNVNLVSDAWDVFDNVPIENGLEAWRQINMDTTQLTEAEIFRLEDHVLAPIRVSDPGQVPQALVRWDAAYKRYIEAGGAQMSEARKVGAIMRTLPKDIHDKALWDIEKFRNSPAALRTWITQKTRNVTRGGYDGEKKPVNMLLAEYDTLPDGLEEEIEALGDVPQETICAFVKKRMGNFRKPGPRRDQKDPPPRDVRDVRCPNCGEKGHVAQDCKKPRVELKDRPCFNCGERGHTSRNCPKNQGKGGKALVMEEAANLGPVSINCIEVHDPTCQDACCGGGFKPVVRPRRREVRRLCVPGPDRGPTAVTLGDYAGSVFAQIANLEAVNAVGESEEPSESSLTSRVAKFPLK